MPSHAVTVVIRVFPFLLLICHQYIWIVMVRYLQILLMFMAETADSLSDFTVRKQKVAGFSKKQQYVEVFVTI